ncbi:MAG: thiolase family protein [Gemmatimonas sp.]|nr:thiolase family protein [Gemmatimonas sp.]
MTDVVVAGTGMTRFAKQPHRRLRELVVDAVHSALADARLAPSDLTTAFFGNAVAGSVTGQEMILGQVSLRDAGISDIPIVNVENACASASTAFHLACSAVATHSTQIAIAVGAEQMSHPDKSLSIAVIGRAADVDAREPNPEATHSYFMELYADHAKKYMDRAEATPNDLAAVAAKNHFHGSLNELAQYGAELSLADVLGSREIVWPLTLLMCSPISDGAAAAIVMNPDLLDRDERTPLIRVLASELGSGSEPGAENASRRVAHQAYERASVGPDELDLVELHDAAASAELELYEDLGLAGAGDGAGLIRSDYTRLGGTTPVNTSGGLLARGHPIGATGLGQIHEIVRQLRGECGDRQVEGARVGATHNAGGWLQGDNGAVAVHIFERVGGCRGKYGGVGRLGSRAGRS